MPAFPKWFDEGYYAQQKVAQMNAIDFDSAWLAANGNGATAWTTELYQQYLAQYTLDGQHFDAYQNFEACNGSGYAADITIGDINVSPNKYFNVGQYCQALADYANVPGNYEQTAPEGGWTAQNVLQHMLDQYHISAWDHFNANWDTLNIDPSSLFDMGDYFAQRAAAMGEGATAEDAKAAIKASGLNPIQDYFENREAMKLPEPVAGDPVQVPADFAQWGAGSAPVEDDPYANSTPVEAAKGEDHLVGEDGVNTEFMTNYGNLRANQTLQADDTFTGGANAHNTLNVYFGSNWAGFNGVEEKNEETGETTTKANVTGVQRLVLDHITENVEQTYTFNAKNIAGLERVDIVNKGAGTAQVSELTKSMQELRLSGDSSSSDGTILSYKKGEIDGKDVDALTLVLENVGAVDKNGNLKTAAKVSAVDIEDLTVKGQANSDNFVDLSGFEDLEAIRVTGAGNVTITDVVSKGIKSYDASEATGNINIAVGKIDGETVIKGGKGLNDTINLTTGTNRFDANWTGVETLVVSSGASANMDFTGSDGSLSTVWVNGGNTTLNGLKAGTFTVQHFTADANVKVNGMENLVWSDNNTSAPIKAKIESDVKNDATLNVGANESLEGAQFTLNSAKGAVTLNVAEAVEDDPDSVAGFVKNTKFNAEAAESFTANISGKLDTGNTFNVVGGEPNQGRAVNIIAADVALDSKNTLTADGATDVTLDLTAIGAAIKNTVTFDGSLKNAQTVNVELANNATQPAALGTLNDYTLDMSAIALKNANEVVISGDGLENVKIGAIGDSGNNEAISLNASSLNGFESGDMLTGAGWDITAQIIDISGAVKIGDIKAGTDQAGNGEGDVHITVSCTGDLSSSNSGKDINISGDALIINFEGVGGKIASGKEVKLCAQSTITYDGNGGSNDESVAVTAVTGFDNAIGRGDSSFDMGDSSGVDKIDFTGAKIANGANITIEGLGGGKDEIKFDATSVAANAFVNVTIDLDDGGTAAEDKVEFKSQTAANAKMYVELENFDATSGTKDTLSGLYKTAAVSKADAAKVLYDFGIASGNIADIAEDVAAGSVTGTFKYGDSLYGVDNTTNATVLVCIGDDDLTGFTLS